MNSLKNNLFAPLLIALTCFEVSDMTCGNCVKKIKDRLVATAGVSRVEVSLSSSRVTLHTAHPLSARESKDVLTVFKQLNYPAKPIPCAL